MRKRGLEFLNIPPAYYDDLFERIASIPSLAYVRENFDEIRNNQILCDFDESGYLLQIFTKPLTDRPTLFFEII